MENNWRGIAVFLIILCVILGINLISQSKYNTYDFGDGFEINKDVFDEMAEEFPDNQSVIGLCSLEENKCKKIDLGGLE